MFYPCGSTVIRHQADYHNQRDSRDYTVTQFRVARMVDQSDNIESEGVMKWVGGWETAIILWSDHGQTLAPFNCINHLELNIKQRD